MTVSPFSIHSFLEMLYWRIFPAWSNTPSNNLRWMVIHSTGENWNAFSPKSCVILTDTISASRTNICIFYSFRCWFKGKISSIEEIFDVLNSGTKYKEAVNGGIVLFKNGVSVHISDDEFIKTVVGNAKIKDTWELIKWKLTL